MNDNQDATIETEVDKTETDETGDKTTEPKKSLFKRATAKEQWTLDTRTTRGKVSAIALAFVIISGSVMIATGTIINAPASASTVQGKAQRIVKEECSPQIWKSWDSIEYRNGIRHKDFNTLSGFSYYDREITYHPEISINPSVGDDDISEVSWRACATVNLEAMTDEKLQTALKAVFDDGTGSYFANTVEAMTAIKTGNGIEKYDELQFASAALVWQMNDKLEEQNVYEGDFDGGAEIITPEAQAETD